MKRKILVGAALLALAMPAMASAQVSDPEQPGSFLVFQRFDWRTGTDTVLRITNLHEQADIGVKLNFVCPGVFLGDQRCRALDRTYVLTPHETRSITLSAIRPACRRGFAVAYALGLDYNKRPTGPVSFNHLTGSWHISAKNKLEAENAVAFQSPRNVFTALGVGSPLKLRFGTDSDEQDYYPAGSELSTDFRGINAATNEGSALALLALDTIAGQQNPATSVYIDFWNEVEVPFSTSHEFVCWDDVALNIIDANFDVAQLGTPAGSMVIGALPNCPLPGGCGPLQWYDPVLLGAITEYKGSAGSTRNLFSDDDQKATAYVPR